MSDEGQTLFGHMLARLDLQEMLSEGDGGGFDAVVGNLRYTKRPMYCHHPHGVEIDGNAIIGFFRAKADKG